MSVATWIAVGWGSKVNKGQVTFPNGHDDAFVHARAVPQGCVLVLPRPDRRFAGGLCSLPVSRMAN